MRLRLWMRLAGAVLVCGLLAAAALPGSGAVEAAGKGKELDPHTPVSSDGTVGQAINGPVDRTYRDGAASLPYEGDPDPAAHGVVRPIIAVDDVAPASAGDDFGIFSVIGTDGRTQVTNTTAFPYRAIVHISSSIGGCTGWMISARTVATAGHCIHNGSWATNVVVSPGRNGSSYPYGSCRGTNLYSVSGWTTNRDTNYDYGAIQLDCTIGNTTGWIGFRYTSSSLTGTAENISGYPGDKPSGTQWQHADQIRNTLTYKLEYQNDTYGGQSGSPVYQASHSACSNGPCAIAIHTNGGSTYNRGTRITQAVFNNLNNWK